MFIVQFPSFCSFISFISSISSLLIATVYINISFNWQFLSRYYYNMVINLFYQMRKQNSKNIFSYTGIFSFSEECAHPNAFIDFFFTICYHLVVQILPLKQFLCRKLNKKQKYLIGNYKLI